MSDPTSKRDFGLQKFFPDEASTLKPKTAKDVRQGKSRRLDYTEIVPGKAAPGNAGGRLGVRKAWKPKGR